MLADTVIDIVGQHGMMTNIVSNIASAAEARRKFF
jgi:hypothetical protein